MRDTVAIVVSFVAVLLVIAYAVTNGFERVTVGSLSTYNLESLITLVNSDTPITGGNYDSFERPRGSPYQVPPDTTFWAVRFNGTPLAASGQDVEISLGCGDDAVSDSLSAPTNAVVIASITWVAENGLPAAIPIGFPFPAGCFPFVLANNGYAVSIVGVER